MKITDSLPKEINESKIEKEILEGKWDYLLDMMSPSMFRHVLEENDTSKAVTMVKNTLQKTDPENANEEYAKELYFLMIKYAKVVLKRYSDKRKKT